jgi:hypothetical protein
MSRALLAFLTVGLFSFSTSAWAQISLRHVTGCGPQTFPASTCTIPSTESGNLLVAAWMASGTATTPAGVTDDAGHIYSEAGNAKAIDTGANLVADRGYAKNSRAGATVSFKAAGSAAAVSACDLNSDGAVNNLDAQLGTNMILGLAPCTANVNGAGVCNAVVLQRVVNAAMGGPCVVGTPHTASLTWTASTSTNVAGYNIYRATTSGGPYAKVNSSLMAGTSYTDSAVQSGQTYYYVSTAVDNTGAESAFSNQSQGAVPNP